MHEKAELLAGNSVQNTSVRAWIGPVLLAMAVSGVAQGFVRYTFAFLLPAMTASVFEGSYGAGGLFVAVNLGAYAVGVVSAASLASRVGSTALVKWGLAGCAVGLMLLATGSSVWLLVVGMALSGGFGAVAWVPLAGVVASWVPPARRGLAFGLVVAGSGVTIALIGVVTEVLQSHRGAVAWREVWLTEAIATLVVLALVLWRLRPGESSDPRDSRRVSPRGLGRRIPLIRVCAMYGVWGVSYGVFVNYLVAALQDVEGISAAESYRLYGFLGIATILGSVLIGRVSDRWGSVRTLVVTTMLAGGAALTVAFSTDRLVLFLVVILYGLVMTGPGILIPAYLSESLRPAEVVAAFGAATFCLAASQFLAPPLGGWLADSTESFSGTYLFAALAAVLSAAVAMSLRGCFRRTSDPDPAVAQ